MSALTKEALRSLAQFADDAAFAPRTAEDFAQIADKLRGWADDLEHAENGDELCEGCDVWLAEGEGHVDVDGVRLCSTCWDELIAEPGT